jgi:hypothetical protein
MISNRILKQSLQSQLLQDRNVVREFDRVAQEQFQKIKKKMLAEFENHQVTKDLESFGSSDLVPRGTLFGFLGFEKGQNPVDALRDVLERGTTIRPGRIKMNQGERVYVVTIPTKDELYAATPLPWAPGRSWLKAVEFGISGLGNYMAVSSSSSRSGEGIQVENANLGGRFRNVKYISSILKNMQKELLSIGMTIR